MNPFVTESITESWRALTAQRGPSPRGTKPKPELDELQFFMIGAEPIVIHLQNVWTALNRMPEAMFKEMGERLKPVIEATEVQLDRLLSLRLGDLAKYGMFEELQGDRINRDAVMIALQAYRSKADRSKTEKAEAFINERVKALIGDDQCHCRLGCAPQGEYRKAAAAVVSSKSPEQAACIATSLHGMAEGCISFIYALFNREETDAVADRNVGNQLTAVLNLYVTLLDSLAKFEGALSGTTSVVSAPAVPQADASARTGETPTETSVFVTTSADARPVTPKPGIAVLVSPALA